MSRFLVTDLHPRVPNEAPAQRIVEAASYEYDKESGGHEFRNADEQLVARFLNVSVEPAPAADGEANQ